jgi:hypothetical protein
LISLAQKHNLKELDLIIEEIEEWEIYNNKNTQKLRDLYTANANKIEKYFNLVVQCGMYMRGWNGTGDYILSETESLNTGLEFEIVEENVNTKIQEIFNYNEEINLELLKYLPLMKYETLDNDEKTFIISPDPEDGDSINDRLKIVADGSTHKSMKSCMRLSSNIILSTAYYYMCSIGMNPGFDIKKLENIA